MLVVSAGRAVTSVQRHVICGWTKELDAMPPGLWKRRAPRGLGGDERDGAFGSRRAPEGAFAGRG
jgi:hypothetical protein